MKKIFLLLIVIITFNISKGQSTHTNYYDKDGNYIGSGTTTKNDNSGIVKGYFNGIPLMAAGTGTFDWSAYDKATELNKQRLLQANKYVEQAQKYYNNNDYVGTINACNNALSLYPRHFTAFAFRGAALKKQGRTSEAIKDFNKAIRLNRNEGELYVWRGDCYVLIGNKQNGCKDYKRAKKLNNLNAGIRIQKYCTSVTSKSATNTLTKKNVTKTTDYSNYYEKFDESKANEYFNQGLDAYLKGFYNKAIVKFDFAIIRDNKNKAAYYNRGLCYLYINDTIKACSDFKKAYEFGVKDAGKELEEYCK